MKCSATSKTSISIPLPMSQEPTWKKGPKDGKIQNLVRIEAKLSSNIARPLHS